MNANRRQPRLQPVLPTGYSNGPAVAPLPGMPAPRHRCRSEGSTISMSRRHRIPGMTMHTGTAHPIGTTAPTEPSSIGRRLLASPGWPISIACWLGSVLLIASSAIHLHLWSTGYRHIPTIGPLFLLQGVAGIVMAVAVAVSRQAVVTAVGALLALGTIGGLVLSVEIGLFGFRDSFSAPDATLSLVVEAAAFVVLAAASVAGLLRARRSAA